MKFVLILTLAMAQPGSSQAPKCSARAIFLGQNGAIPPAGCEATKPQPNSKPTPANPAGKLVPAATATTDTTMSAIMYWIELIKPSGEMQRVTTDRVFQSGEKIRIHVQSNVSGRLTIAELRPDGASQVLFPNAGIRAGDAVIEAKVDTAIPPTGHFKFDNETGTDRLMVLLSPSGIDAPDEKHIKAGAVLDAAETSQLARNLTAKRGVVFETDEAPANKAVYAAAVGNIALEIRLKHQ